MTSPLEGAPEMRDLDRDRYQGLTKTETLLAEARAALNRPPIHPSYARELIRDLITKLETEKQAADALRQAVSAYLSGRKYRG